MCSFRMPASAKGVVRLGRQGFTLVELLVSLVIGALLTGVILQLMQGQASFVDIQSARQEVQQNARGTLELLSSELRAVPPGAITVAQANRIEFRVPRVWGITCSAMSGGSGTVWVLIPQGTFPADFPADPATATHWGFAVPAVGGGGSWRWLTIASRATGTPVCDPTFNMADLRNYSAIQLGYSGLGNARPVGSDVFIYQHVIYEAGTGTSSTRTWVKRNNGSSTTQVMAGPLTATNGLVFDYWCATGKIAPPGSSSSGFPKLRAVQAKVTMESTRGTTAGRQLETDSALIALRNVPGGITC